MHGETLKLFYGSISLSAYYNHKYFTHNLRSKSKYAFTRIFRKSCRLWDNVAKCCRVRGAI